MNPQLSSLRIAFLGAGSMAEAIIRGLIEQKKTSPEQIFSVNRQDQSRLEQLHNKYGVQISSGSNNRQNVIEQADILVLAMKPKDAEQAFEELKSQLKENQLIISVIAGLSIAKIQALLETRLPIIRTMPNTSCSIGLGVTGVSFSSAVSIEQQQLATSMFEAVGIVSVVDETKLEIITGLSGSGPAYIYYFMEAMTQAAVEGGLAREEAHRLTLQTVLGAAHMVQTTEEDPAELRRKVTSPNGATQAAIEILDQHQFAEGIMRAVFRSAERAKEMGEQIAAHSIK